MTDGPPNRRCVLVLVGMLCSFINVDCLLMWTVGWHRLGTMEGLLYGGLGMVVKCDVKAYRYNDFLLKQADTTIQDAKGDVQEAIRRKKIHV